MLKNIELCGYEVPTPIQAYVIPSVLNDRDVIGIAQTGKIIYTAFRIPAYFVNQALGRQQLT